MTFSKRSRTQFCFPFLGLFPRFFLLSCAIDTPKSRWKRRRELGVHLSKFGRKENCTQESSEKLQAPGENQIHDPPSSSSCDLATEAMEALCPPGSKFNFNYIEITQKTWKKKHSYSDEWTSLSIIKKQRLDLPWTGEKRCT